MEYENRPVPEGINVSQEHPLKEFAILASGLLLIVTLAIAGLSFAAGWMAQYVPFEVEQKIASTLVPRFSPTAEESSDNTQPSDQAIEAYLQNLANQLAKAQGVPDNMPITVHYLKGDTVNAFATLGGHVFFFEGLVKRLPHENALSMVMAHEIAHIKHRDPLVAAGRGLTIALALASLGGFTDNAQLVQWISQMGLLTNLSFGRDQERAADRAAFDTLLAHYQHTQGAEALFEVLQDANDGPNLPEIFSTHPLTEDRIEQIKSLRQSTVSPPQITPMPKLLTETFASDQQTSQD